MLHVLNNILCSVDGGDPVLLALLELSVAFGTAGRYIYLQGLSAE